VIDWTTVAFQIVNFLILLFILKWLLYGRIIKAIDSREAEIAAQFKEAEEKKKEAGAEAQSYREKNEEFDASRQEMLAQAKQETEAHRKELMSQARQDVDALHDRWREAVERERAAFLIDLRQRVSKQTCAIARRTLSDLAGVELEQRLIDAFIEKLQGLGDEERQALAQPAEGTSEEDRRIVVRSAFDIPDEKRQQIAELVRAKIAEGVEVAFETSPEVICGIELKAHGRKLAWSVDNYLDTLEENLREAFEQQPPEEALKAEIDRDARKDEEEQAEKAEAEERQQERDEAVEEPKKAAEKENEQEE